MKRSGNRERVLLIGHRNAAVAAAKRCGWRAASIDLRSREEQTPRAFGGTRARALEEAMALFPDAPPRTVAAVATGSVLAAAAIRDHFGLSGLPLEVAMRCHDKLIMKKAVAHAGISCAPWMETNEATTAEDLIAHLGLPVVLKMPISSGGRGVWVCSCAEAVRSHLGPGLLAEGFVQGTEMSVETFRAKDRTVFRNHTRYLMPAWANVVPADLDEPEADRVDALAERVHEALGINTGISHMEIFLTPQGPVFGEIAARPPGGYLMELIQRAYDFDPWEALLRIAVGEEAHFPSAPRCAAGVWILHPGAGVVREVRGLERARKMPGVREISCILSPGDRVGVRVGSGQTKGRVVVEDADARECGRRLTKAMHAISFELEKEEGDAC